VREVLRVILWVIAGGAGVLLAIEGVEKLVAWWRREEPEDDVFRFCGVAVTRAMVQSVDRRVHPDGRRDVIVRTVGGARVVLTGDARRDFLFWWEVEDSPPMAG